MKNKALKLSGIAVGLIVVVGLGVSANAFGRHWGGGMMMRHMDANGDGKVTREEIMPRLIRKFDKVDGNADGKVTKAEVEAHVRKRVARKLGHIFARFDTNEDGVMTKPELEAHVEKHFSKLDRDGNGEVSRDEMRTFRTEMRQHMRKFFERDN